MYSIDFTSWIFPVLTVVYAVTILSCVTVVLSEKRNPIKSLAWVTALIFLPVAGLIFYLFFGRSMKNLHMISRHNKRKLLSRQPKVPREVINSLTLSDYDKQLIRLADSTDATSLSCAYSIEIFTRGEDKFKSLRHDLENARQSINLQYYIFSDDSLGFEIADILMRKAREGLKVRVIYDHVGSFSVRTRFFTKMKEAGVDAHPFFRVTFPQLASRVNWRNHRKIVVIDDNISYIGGMNIARRYIDGMNKGGIEWRDTHLRLEGPISTSLLYSFAVDWNFIRHHADIHPINPPKIEPGLRQIPMQLITSGPNDKWSHIAILFQKAILSAKKSVYIQTPYFLPTEALLSALQTAALAKVDVRIMIPRKSDSTMLRYASYSYIGECLAAGIKIYFYESGMLHAKTMIIDEEFSTTGSTNFDFRSFEHNFEANLLIYDKDTNRRMRNIFFEDIEKCTKITHSVWQHRPTSQRFWESIMRLTSPVL